MTYIDGFRLFGTKAKDGELYSMGWVQINRSDLSNPDKRGEALALLLSFARRQCFPYGDVYTKLWYEWGQAHDTLTEQTTYFEVPDTVNRVASDTRTEAAPVDEIVARFLAEATGLISLTLQTS